MDGPPFFDREGQLAINIESKTWQFSEDAGWRGAAYQKGSGDKAREQPPSTVPGGCPISRPDSIVRQDGICSWLTWRNQLYKAIPGLCRPQFEAAEYHPFMDGRQVLDRSDWNDAGMPLTDRKGNTFLQTGTSNGAREYVVLMASTPLPDTGLNLKKAGADAVTAAFSTTSRGKAWFVWRIDGETWSDPITDSRITIAWIPNGRHRLEAAAIDQELRRDATPAASEFKVDIDPARQIAAMIRALNESDETRRESAVGGLARQAALALPALKQAREKASGSWLWWIDATIQRIEAHGR